MNNNNEKLLTNNNLFLGSSQYQDNTDYSHKGENCHSKKSKIQEELEKRHREQYILLKENKQNIIDFRIYNKDSIRVEDLKIYEPVYKCYREKGNCYICNSLANIICINCCNNYNNNREIWLCISHWKQHAIETMNNR